MAKRKILLLSIFVFSLLLRFTLCLINRQSNDNHLEVISWIVDKHEIPVKENCWECSQPKFFYVLNAGIISAFEINDPVKRIISVQLVNLIFGFFILLFIWKFIDNQPFSHRTKLLTFSLVAFNPCLTGINVQATNDTLEILGGVCTIYFAQLFFINKNVKSGLCLIAFAVFASVVKGSGLVIGFAVFVIFLFKLFSANKIDRILYIKIFSLFIIVYLAIVPFAGGYYQNYLKYNDPFINNIDKKDPPPQLFHQTYPKRPGITSVAHGYFTFRIFEMIRQPYYTNVDTVFPLHRTSLWSQLYGRTFFMHYDQFPGTWSTTNPKIIMPGRLMMLLALAPLSMLLIGFLKELKLFIINILNLSRNYFAMEVNWMYLIFISGYLLFMIKYTYDYRDFATMKSIFIFPALPAFIKLFMDGFSKIKSKRLFQTASLMIGLLVFLSIYDIAFLIKQLANPFFR